MPVIGQNCPGLDVSNCTSIRTTLPRRSSGAWWVQTIFIAVITGTQAILNHIGIRATTILTDFSGYLIFVVRDRS